MASTIAALQESFAALYSRPSDGVWTAPGRVNLIGEHTDYNDGFVLPFAIDKSTQAAIALRPDARINVRSTFADDAFSCEVNDVEPGRNYGWAGYPLGVAWAMAQRGIAIPGFDLLIDSTIPVGAGLSSSAAIECSTAAALNELTGANLDLAELARIGRNAENDIVGAPTGIMDQSASLFGQRDGAVFLDCRSLVVEVVPLKLRPAGLKLLVIDTRVTHAHATGGYADRRASCERGASALGVASLRDIGSADLERAAAVLDEQTFRRVRHIVTENDRVLESAAALRRNSPEALGTLLDDSHTSMRDDFEISSQELDVAVQAARDAGAIGARMTGGGFGGSAIALTPAPAVQAVHSAIEAAFRRRKFAAPNIFEVLPSEGAHRLS